MIKVALEQVGNRHGTHPVNINIPDNLPYILVDPGLMVQAFINILDNSFKYSPPESAVDITAELLGESKLKLRSLIMGQEFRLRISNAYLISSIDSNDRIVLPEPDWAFQS